MIVTFLKKRKKSIINTFWKEEAQSMYDLRVIRGPVTDYEYRSWPLWYDQVIKLPEKKLQKCNVSRVSDLLGTSWEILSKEEIERTRSVTLNFLEYLSIKQSIKEFIKKRR